MENETQKQTHTSSTDQATKKDYSLAISIILAAIIISSSWLWKDSVEPKSARIAGQDLADLEQMIVPTEGVKLPIQWGDLGIRLAEAGVIDLEKFKVVYEQRGGLDQETEELLTTSVGRSVVVNAKNAQTLLNLFWAFGLANKNEILEKGEMTDKKYGGDPSRFASTGGWTLAKGNIMDHYSRHQFVSLTTEQQTMVDDVSRNIYRPCCGNSTHFPDCNHGMAMLGLLELMAAQGVNEEEMYRTALAVNSYWFPDTYLTIATYLKNKGIDWPKVSPKEILSAEYSSGAGYQRVLKQIQPSKGSSISCGV